MTLFTQAEALVQAGVAIIPLKPDRSPAITGWQEKATTDMEVVREWFEKPKYYGIGIPCGPDQDLIAFDLDMGKTEDAGRIAKLQAWYDEHFEPESFMARKTRSGGLHVICAWPDKASNQIPRTIMPKFDVIKRGFYFVWDTMEGEYSHFAGLTSFDDLAAASVEMCVQIERPKGASGEGGQLPTDAEAHEILVSNGDDGMRHEALLKLAYDWVMVEENYDTDWRVFENWFLETYGYYFNEERLKTMTAGEQNEICRAVVGAQKQYAPASDDLLARAAEKLFGTAPLMDVTQEVRDQAQGSKDNEQYADAVKEARRDLLFGVDADVIPPRQWMLGKYLIKGKVTTLSAPGGTGKSMLALVWAASLCSGNKLLAASPHHKCKVLVHSGEDDRMEMLRRLAAIKMRHGLPELPHMALSTQQERDLRLVVKGKDNIVVRTAAVDALIADVRQAGVEVLIVDPLISLHSVDENKNEHMDVVMDQLVRIATEADVAVLVVHHVAKGSMRDDRRGDPADAARGATAIVNRARVALALSVMNLEEAAQNGIPVASRYSYVQVVDAKANLAARTGYASADWVQLVAQSIENGTEDYPEGDELGVPVRYEMGSVMPTDIASFVAIGELMQAETARDPADRRDKAHPASSQWFGHLVADACNLTWGEYSRQESRTAEQQAAYDRVQAIITAMVEAELIHKTEVMGSHRKHRPGYALKRGFGARLNQLREVLNATI